MLSIEDYRSLFVIVGFVGILLFASLTLTLVLHSSSGESFSELWVLGAGHMIEYYPFDVKEGDIFNVFVGVGNHMGSSSYYVVKLKFRNQIEPLPNVTTGEPSIVDSLVEYSVFLGDGEVWEKNVTFSFSGVKFEGNMCRVSNLNVDGAVFFVNKTATWDSVNKGYFFQIFFELWRYNAVASLLEYHNRFVNFWLNVTV